MIGNYICTAMILLILILNIQTSFCEPSDEKSKAFLEYQKGMAEMKQERPEEYKIFRRLSTLNAQMLLGRLGYGICPYDGVLDRRTQKAIREYEKNRGIPVTGDPMSFETSKKLKEDAETIEKEPIFLPSLVFVNELWDKGYFKAQGTWVIVDGEIGWPEQTSQIDCSREWGICIEATATMRGSRGIDLQTDIYYIEQWDQQEIVTKPKDWGCVRHMRRVNRIQRSVTGIRSTILRDGACKEIEAKELHMILTDGYETTKKLDQEYNDRLKKLFRFTPDIINLLDQPSKRSK